MKKKKSTPRRKARKAAAKEPPRKHERFPPDLRNVRHAMVCIPSRGVIW